MLAASTRGEATAVMLRGRPRLDPDRTNLTPWLRLLRTVRQLDQREPGSDAVTGLFGFSRAQLTEGLAVVARRQGNVKLAGRLLDDLDLRSPPPLSGTSGPAWLRYQRAMLFSGGGGGGGGGGAGGGGAGGEIVITVNSSGDRIGASNLVEMWRLATQAPCGDDDQRARACVKVSRWLRAAAAEEGMGTALLKSANLVPPPQGLLHRGSGDIAEWCVGEATRVSPGFARGWRALAQWADTRAATLERGGNGAGGGGAGASFAAAELIDDIDGVCGAIELGQGAIGGLGDGGDDGGAVTDESAAALYAQAAHAHFQYLALVSTDAGGGRGRSKSASLGALESMLRLLAIAARAAAVPAVAAAFTNGLNTVCAAPWAAVTPQLLALLRSDCGAVRSVAQRILCRVAAAAPHAAAYPVAVELAAAADEAAAAAVDAPTSEDTDDSSSSAAAAAAATAAKARLALDAVEPVVAVGLDDKKC